MHSVPRGGFHKAGEGPAFGDSFPDFSSGRNRAQRSVPARLASLNRDIGEESTYLSKVKNSKKYGQLSLTVLFCLIGD